MKKSGLFLLVLAVLLMPVITGSAWAGNRAGAVTISPMGGGYGFDDERDLLDFGKMFSGGLGYNFNKVFSTELFFSYLHTDADICNCEDDDIYAYQPRLDFLVHLMPDSMFVPYLAAGVGYMFFDDDDIDPMEIDDTLQANGGLGVKLFVTEDIALRGDARYYYGFEDSQSEYALTAGLVFQFGGEKKMEPEPCVDADNDGVCDDVDQCPGTPAGARVDSVGCEIVSEPYAVMEKEEETGEIMEESDEEVIVVVEEEEPEMMEVIVYFDFDKAEIKPIYFDRLADLAAFMQEYPEIDAVIEGHTDSIGTDSYNVDLSRRRSSAVKNFLIDRHGVDPNRFVIKYYGEERPVAPNTNPENRQLNRRTITVTIMP